MGKTKTAFVSETPEGQKKALEKKRAKYEAKKAARRIRVPGLGGGQRVVAVEAEPFDTEQSRSTQDKPTVETTPSPTTPKKTKSRGKKYLAARTKVDPTKTYTPDEAVKLAKETSFSSFPGRIEAHLVLTGGSLNKTVDLPHSTGQTRKTEIASDETIEKLKLGKIDFDLLIASPSMMPKLVPFAKLLGPRGLMPNPKQGTVSEKPEEVVSRFSGNTLQLKTEAKAPLLHTVIGKVDQTDKELSENLSAVVAAVKDKTVKGVVVKATMGPAIKVAA